MTEKEKYIGAYLDGYFSDKNTDYGMKYISMLNNAIEEAEIKYKDYKKKINEERRTNSQKNK